MHPPRPETLSDQDGNKKTSLALRALSPSFEVEEIALMRALSPSFEVEVEEREKRAKNNNKNTGGRSSLGILATLLQAAGVRMTGLIPHGRERQI